METTTLALTEFLLARIAEDEETARRAQRHYQHVLGIPHYFTANSDTSVAMNPRVALVECEAKRRIVALHRLAEGPTYRGTPCCARCTADGEYPADDAYTDEQNWPCPTLRLLALPYADHPDYREEWKP